MVSSKLSNVQLLSGSLGSEVKLSNRVLSMSVFGCDIYEKYPELFRILKDKRSYSESKKLNSLVFLYKTLFNTEKYLLEMSEVCERVKCQFSENAIKALTNTSDLFNLIENGIKEFENAGLYHMALSNNSIVYQQLAFSVLIQKSKILTTNHQSDIGTILGSISNVESANVPEMIAEITGKIVLSKKRESFLEIESCDGVDWLETNCSEAFELFVAFIKRHGHRSINELDFIAKPWKLQPETIIDMIKSNLSSGLDVFNRKKTSLSVDETLDKLNTPLGMIPRFFLRKILPRCQKGVQNREKAKSCLVTVVDEIRRALTRLGTLMVHEGLLPDKDLIFHLSISEIKDVIVFRDGRLVSRAVRRQRMFSKLKDFKFPELSFGIPRPETAIADNFSISADNVLVRGIPVCGGVVTGYACVCRSFADVFKLKKGDILITYATDIGWSPCFPILGGICTEIGKFYVDKSIFILKLLFQVA